MSCVVGLIHKGVAWIGCDSRVTNEDGDISYSSVKKLHRYNKYLVGVVGNARVAQLLDPYYFTPPKNILDWSDNFREFFKEKGCMVSNEDGAEISECNFLIGFNNRLFQMLANFQMAEITTYTAIGAGAGYAVGSLFTTSIDPRLNPKDRILTALKAASHFSTACGPPYIIEKV